MPDAPEKQQPAIDADRIAANLDALRRRIAAVCDRASRCPSTVALMAVSKVHPAEVIVAAIRAGHKLFGENRVQEFAAKRDLLAGLFSGAPDAPKMHLIGPLQNNKTARAAELFDAVDTLDSAKTALRLNASAAALGRTLPALIEVKLSPEEAKHGVDPADLGSLLATLAPLTNLRVTGLMTVPPWSEDAETARPYFRELRRLRDEHAKVCPSLTDLSMGMSNDFEVGIEEGSTCVRIGTAIFGKRTP
jgi:pyridoxal phosphate enzyme (YggS family)